MLLLFYLYFEKNTIVFFKRINEKKKKNGTRSVCAAEDMRDDSKRIVQIAHFVRIYTFACK